jgi:hypothetical protein
MRSQYSLLYTDSRPLVAQQVAPILKDRPLARIRILGSPQSIVAEQSTATTGHLRGPLQRRRVKE